MISLSLTHIDPTIETMSNFERWLKSQPANSSYDNPLTAYFEQKLGVPSTWTDWVSLSSISINGHVYANPPLVEGFLSELNNYFEDWEVISAKEAIAALDRAKSNHPPVV